MIQSCTCGARPPEDARFCHKCGRPLYELSVPEPEPVPPPLPVTTVDSAKTLGVTLRNPRAVRVGMLVAAGICLLQSVPLPSFFQPLYLLILLLGGGFISVYLYHRRTGDPLTVLAGARLGWMTGLFVFLVTLVLFTVTIAGVGLNRFFQEILTVRGTPELTRQFEEILQSPAGLAAMLFLALLTMFFLLTVITSAGGALAAKVLEKD